MGNVDIGTARKENDPGVTVSANLECLCTVGLQHLRLIGFLD